MDNSFGENSITDDKKETTKKRTKSGCFTCRFIKRKCDEARIGGKCTTCYNAFMECFWPGELGDKSGTLTKELRQIISDKLKEGKELSNRLRKEHKKKMLKIKHEQRKLDKEAERKAKMLLKQEIKKQKSEMASNNKKTKRNQSNKPQLNEKLNGKTNKPNSAETVLESAKALLEMSTGVVPSPSPAPNNLNGLKSMDSLKGKEYSLIKNMNPSTVLFNFNNINDTSLLLDKMFDLGVQNETMLAAYFNNNQGNNGEMVDKFFETNVINPVSEVSQALSPLNFNISKPMSPLNIQSPSSNFYEMITNNIQNSTYKDAGLNMNVDTQNLASNESTKQIVSEQSKAMDDDNQYGGLDEELSENEIIYKQLLTRFANRDIQYDFKGLLNNTAYKAEDGSPLNNIGNKENNERELLLYYSFFNYFLPQVGPQNTLPQLSTSVTFPQIEHNSIVKSVFKCCGATFLAWCQPNEYSKVAEDLYDESKRSLQKLLGEKQYIYDVSNISNDINSPDSISTNNSMGFNYRKIKGNEDWIIACFQLLVLRDKLKNGQDVVDRCLENLSHSFETIQNRYLLDSSSEIPNTPIDRMLLESFVYNYTVSISVAKDFNSKNLPNPFDPIITRLVGMLKFPIFENCEVEWLNNPVLGSSVECFIMLAKVSYLGTLKLPLEKDSIWEIRAKELQQQCLYYSPPALPFKIKNNMEKYAKYRPGLLTGSIVSKSCYLLLFKILNYETMSDKEILDDIDIRNVVKYVVNALNEIELGDKLLCILQWSLLIIGAYAKTLEERFVISKYVISVGETIHSHYSNQIKLILEEIWETGNLNILLDSDRISKLVI
ncbi:uncharacterized protein HGUI_00867 [Hanseniaspora guilliermondii]|uniref:Zn(2)-C6 fungal-type domain-containing protein n=1 Tax=Hanseniaspora guilliermondii TaxID=56406 RepID=A0A1L0B120_9ASCO|nr:uncharacterized protein HGUI_00867 [Hanseniaspora guilliermondii]